MRIGHYTCNGIKMRWFVCHQISFKSIVAENVPRESWPNQKLYQSLEKGVKLSPYGIFHPSFYIHKYIVSERLKYAKLMSICGVRVKYRKDIFASLQCMPINLLVHFHLFHMNVTPKKMTIKEEEPSSLITILTWWHYKSQEVSQERWWFKRTWV